MTRIFLLALLCSIQSFAQDAGMLRGSVHDASTGKALQYASVRVEGLSIGTTADGQGRFTLRLPQGRHTVVASFIGYRSEKKSIDPALDTGEATFRLAVSRIEMKAVTVTPGDNPALAIIRAAIAAKHKQRETLESYHFTSHSKLTISVSMKTKRAEIEKDSSASELMETQTEVWWAKPDQRKEIITARKQTASIPAQMNILNSAWMLTDFSSDLLPVGSNAPIVGPISEAGLKRYDYTLTGTTTLDGELIHIIRIKALSDNDPLLNGLLYIADGSFVLVMVDVEDNPAALYEAGMVRAEAGGIAVPVTFEKVSYQQHFRLYEKQYWMPTDVVVQVRCKVTLVSLAIECGGFSVLQDYEFNMPVKEDFFDRTPLIVLKEADLRDSAYWTAHQKIPNTPEEIDAYTKYPTLAAAASAESGGGWWPNVSIPSSGNIYRFNRVRGHELRLPMTFTSADGGLGRVDASVSYGFADRRGLYDLAATRRYPHAGDLAIAFKVFRSIGDVEETHPSLNSFGTTVANLFFKFDDKDYYYKNGKMASVSYDVFRLFPTTLSLGSIDYSNAGKNTNWSITRQSWDYRANPPINEGNIFDAELSTTFDNRDFMDNAGELSRIGQRPHALALNYGYHIADLDTGKHSYHTLGCTLQGSFELGTAGSFSYRLEGAISSGALPVQRLYNLPGSVRGIAGSWRFRTLEAREFGGDRFATAYAEYDFRGELFRMLGIPSGLGLVIFGSAGYASMNQATRDLQTVPTRQALAPFYEAGFGLDRLPLGLRLDYTWRLSHYRDGRNFVLGVRLPLVQ